jgi:hypothetical protein
MIKHICSAQFMPATNTRQHHGKSAASCKPVNSDRRAPANCRISQHNSPHETARARLRPPMLMTAAAQFFFK